MRTAHRLSIAAGALAAVLAAGACTGSSPGTKAPASGAATGDGRLAYARCMRGHGVDVPDPTPGGNLDIPVDAPADAQAACAQQLGGGGVEAPADGPQMSAAEQQAMLAYARCMRAQGRDYPDPVFKGGSAAQIGDGRRQIDITSPAFKEADAACRKELHAAGVQPPP